MNYLIVRLIEKYQKSLSPGKPKSCRFMPSCSEYSKQCFLRFNFFKASYLTVIRLFKCSPFKKMCSYDPIPKKRKKKH